MSLEVLQPSQLADMATQVRRDILRMVHGAKSGHPGGSLGCADFLTCLYFNEMSLNPNKFKPSAKDEDVFLLSNGHISPVLYSVLARRGYFPISELSTFRQLGARLQGHPSIAHGLPGIRMASGSLGQGLSNAIGVALAKKLDNDSRYVYCLCGDGELQEGQNWEALMFAASHKVDNLIAVVDYNKLQIDGAVSDVCDLGDLEAKIRAFGWECLHMDGHDFDAIHTTLAQARQIINDKHLPMFIIMHTEMGHGIDFMANKNKWHGSAPNDEQTMEALSQLKSTQSDY